MDARRRPVTRPYADSSERQPRRVAVAVFEPVRDDAAELIVIRQIAIDADGNVGYSWEYLEDEREGLTDQAIEPPQHDAPALRRSARSRKVLRDQNRTV
jgi:hypothetical protein